MPFECLVNTTGPEPTTVYIWAQDLTLVLLCFHMNIAICRCWNVLGSLNTPSFLGVVGVREGQETFILNLFLQNCLSNKICLSFHRILKMITYILIAIRVVLCEQYFYISHSKKLKEKAFLKFSRFSELVQATWKTTTLYLVCLQQLNTGLVRKNRVFPGSGAGHSPVSRHSWIPEFHSLQSQSSLLTTSFLIFELNLPVSNYIFYYTSHFKNDNLKYFTFRWTYWRITSLTR